MVVRHSYKVVKTIGMKKIKEKKGVCSICFKDYVGFGNNAKPVNSGRCCDSCNGMIVIYARINCAQRAIIKYAKRRTKTKSRKLS